MASKVSDRRILLGTNPLSLADICRISLPRASICIDKSLNRDQIPSSSKELSSLAINLPDDVVVPVEEIQAENVMDKRLIRVIVALHIHRFIKWHVDSNVCLSTSAFTHMHFLIELYIHDILPPLTPAKCSTEKVGATSMQLLAFMEGKGAAITPEANEAEIKDLREVLSNLKLGCPSSPLETHERAIFASVGSSTLLATTALLVGSLKTLVALADAAAALTCEVLHVDVNAFSLEQVEGFAASRGARTVANSLRLLLEHSVYTSSGHVEDHSKVFGCLECIPQVHGPVRDAIENVSKSTEADLNASISQRALHPHAFRMTVTIVNEGIRTLLDGTTERLHCLREATPAGSTPETNCKDIVLLDQAEAALKAEIGFCLSYFHQEEDKMRARLAEKALRTQQAAAKAEMAQSKEDDKLAGMSAQQLEKIMEKRRKKQEKLKEKEKNTQEGLKLGAGTASLYQFFKNTADKSEWATDASIDLVLEALLTKLASGGTRRKPKIAKGTLDFLPYQMQLREKVLNRIRSVFRAHGGQEIATPVFELKETLTGKYGEDSKLIYDLADQGGELLALRYDLTVPFARFMAMHSPGNIKRFHIARVYRRDNPQMARGRFREFFQCDFDIAGFYASMLPDAEVISVGIEVLLQFQTWIGSFKIKLSHRVLLDAILAICGVPSAKFRTICSAIDKLDKESWDTVRSEMVDEKGLAPEAADKIAAFVCKVGRPLELLAELKQLQAFQRSEAPTKALEELETLFEYLRAMDVLQHISFDLSLARGLDYYTGLIYEFVLTDPENQHVGSIAAGGRYDELVGIFSATGQQIPCVGISIGIERLFSIVQSKAIAEESKKFQSSTQVLVASATACSMSIKLEICKELWRANIAAQVMQLENPKFTKQLHFALENSIPFMIVIGQDELDNQQVKVKTIASKEEQTVSRASMWTSERKKKSSLLYFASIT
uniref:Histidine--tRNA ligase, cytoplasmic n=1 Tax=Albugo laibachii Nc14 TaxID=890382 RepID=F0W496_9STRA|nr:histidyltRNA synthetase putative [Albugo laibachii Nc14]|eukprot:CCA15912.1 histidyltRNA synthetase putative [Albugo laibachii Nc14]